MENNFHCISNTSLFIYKSNNNVFKTLQTKASIKYIIKLLNENKKVMILKGNEFIQK